MESFLFVFKVALERVVLLHEGAMLVGVPLSARVHFLDLAALEAVQVAAPRDDEAAAAAGSAGAGRRRPGVTFEGFPERHTPPFYSDATSMIRQLQRQPLAITLFQQHPAAPLPVVVGSARVPVSDDFCDLLARANRCAARHPLAAVVRGEYPVLDVDGVQVGSVSLTARLVCFDGEALEQMRVERTSRAESTAAAVESRRSSGPCTDDRLVTTNTNVCSKCMLPKRPPSSAGHPHGKPPSQATILEETAERAAEPTRSAKDPQRPSATKPSPARAPAAVVTPTPVPTSAASHAPTLIPDRPTCLPAGLPPPRLSDTSSASEAHGVKASGTSGDQARVGPQEQRHSVQRGRSATGQHGEEASGDTDLQDAGVDAKKNEVPVAADVAAAATDPSPGYTAAPGATGLAVPQRPQLTAPPTRQSAPPGSGGGRQQLPACVAIPSPFSNASRTARSSLDATSLQNPSVGEPALTAPVATTAPRFSAAAPDGRPVVPSRTSTATGTGRHSSAAASAVAGRLSSTAAAAGTGRLSTAAAAVDASRPPGSDVLAARGHDMFLWGDITHRTQTAQAGRSAGGGVRPGPTTLWSGRTATAAVSDWRTGEKERIVNHFTMLRIGMERDSDFEWDLDLDTPLSRYGHKECVVAPRPVPGNQGWLWNMSSSSKQHRRGWYPGAIPRGLGLRTTKSQ